MSGAAAAVLQTCGGLLAGALFIRWSQAWLERREETHGDVRLGSLSGLDARKARP
jgi:hypothetical protein